MPTLGVLIPYYDDGAYLARCLASIKNADAQPDEILIYDDASSDPPENHVAGIDGIRIIRGRTNVGVGQARNELMAASGSEYVHIHDCDDLFRPDWARKVRNAISGGTPDVILTNVSYVKDDGVFSVYREMTYDFHKLVDLRTRTLTSFAIRHRASFLTTACTFRRDLAKTCGPFRRREELSFHEDHEFHVRLFSISSHFSLIDEPLAYQVARSSSLSRDSEGNVRPIVHVERARALRLLSNSLPPDYKDDLAEAAFQRGVLLRKMCLRKESLKVFKFAKRIGKPLYIGKPRSYHLLVRAFGIPMAEELSDFFRKIRRIPERLADVISRTKSRLKSYSLLYKPFRFFKKVFFDFYCHFCRVLVAPLVIGNRPVWMFGSWEGASFNDNSKYLYLHVLKFRRNVEAIWNARSDESLQEARKSGGRVLRIGSFMNFLCSLRAEAFLYSYSMLDVANFDSFAGCQIQLWHGMPLKKIGLDCNPPVVFARPHCTIATTEEFASLLSGAFDLPLDAVGVTGLPRNDALFPLKPPGKTVVFMPTHRVSRDSQIRERILREVAGSAELRTVLDKFGAKLVIKDHLILSAHGILANMNVDVRPPSFDAQRILAEADVLITDYSSCYIDYLLLDRPIIFYAPDRDSYESVRGFYFDYNEATPGPKPKSIKELTECVEKYLTDPSIDALERKRVRDRFHLYQDGSSCERVTRFAEKMIERRGVR